MSFVVGFDKFFCGNVGVALGGADGAVAQHFLNHADVGAVTNHCGGKSVAEGMRVHMMICSFRAGVAVYDIADAAGCKGLAFLIYKKFIGGLFNSILRNYLGSVGKIQAQSRNR